MKDERRLTRRFYRRDAATLARALLGQLVVRRLDDGQRLAGRIVEVEAYLGIPDRAAHTYGGRRTPRNESMWGEAGHAYVYFTYGMHFCLNVVAEGPEAPSACLVRALEPLEGLDTMRRHRAARNRRRELRDTELCSGPARLTEAFAIDRSLDGTDLTSSRDLYVLRGSRIPPERVAVSPRIGVAYAREWAAKPLRFFVRDHPHVSR